MPAVFERIVDLTSGSVVGWEIRTRGTGEDLVSIALAARAGVSAGRFLAVRAPAPGRLRERLRGTGSLDGLALLVEEASTDGLLLERARGRGALVGCDGAATFLRVAELRPELLCLTERAGSGGDRMLAAAAAMAAAVGARTLAHDVGSAERATALGDLGIALAQGAAFGPPLRRPVATDSAVVATLAAGAERTVREWAEDAPSVTRADPLNVIVGHCLAEDDREWLMIVDDESRPLRLVERAALLRGEPFEHRVFTVGPSTSFRALARTAVLRPARDRLRPLALCDEQGRYAGLLRVERLLEALAA